MKAIKWKPIPIYRILCEIADLIFFLAKWKKKKRTRWIFQFQPSQITAHWYFHASLHSCANCCGFFSIWQTCICEEQDWLLCCYITSYNIIQKLSYSTHRDKIYQKSVCVRANGTCFCVCVDNNMLQKPIYLFIRV